MAEINEVLIPPCDPCPSLRMMCRADFTDYDQKGLMKSLSRDPFRHTMDDVERWLMTGEMTMWRFERGEGKFGMLLQLVEDPKQVVICHLWGKDLRRYMWEILEELRKLARTLGCKYIASTFNSIALFEAVPMAKLGYVYGMYEV